MIVRIEKNKRIIVELNNYNDNYILLKNTDYAFSMITRLTRKNNRYPKIYLINIDGVNYFNTKEAILHFKIRDEFGHIENDLYNSIHVILENIDKNSYNADKETKKLATLFKLDNIEDMKKEFKGDESYMKVIEKVVDLSPNEELIGYYDLEQAHLDDIEDAKETGREEGKTRSS